MKKWGYLFLQCFADVGKKSIAVSTVYIYPSKSPRFDFFRKWYWLLWYNLRV